MKQLCSNILLANNHVSLDFYWKTQSLMKTYLKLNFLKNSNLWWKFKKKTQIIGFGTGLSRWWFSLSLSLSLEKAIKCEWGKNVLDTVHSNTPKTICKSKMNQQNFINFEDKLEIK